MVARLALALLVTASACAAADSSLRRHGLAGFAYRAVTEEDVSKLHLPGRKGVVVRVVLPGGSAEKAGLMPGDVIRECGADSVADVSGFETLWRRHYAGDRVRLSVLRAGAARQFEVALEPYTEETGEGLDVEYTSFVSSGVRLRAVIVSPSQSHTKKPPALLMVSALNSPVLATVPQYDMFRDLAHAAARKGFRVLRFQLRGSGDSEGDDFRTTDFSTETADNLAAFDYLAARPDVDSSRVFVYGHSTGGMVAATVVNRRRAAGVILSSTIGRTYYERMAQTLRLQSELAGEQPADIDSKIDDYLDLSLSLVRGEALADILKRNPGTRKLVNSSGRIMDDRTPDYWRQMLGINLAALYGSITWPVLVIRGDSDFLTQRACHEHIRDVLVTAGNKDVELALIPGLDHHYAAARDFKESFANYKTGAFRKDPAAEERILDWLSRNAD